MGATFHDHFSSLAAKYADFRPHYPNELFEFLAKTAPRPNLVWECACGTGQATHGLAAQFDHVIATDASAQQINSAKPNPKVEYRLAPAEVSGLPDQSIDLIAVAQAMHWFNLEKFYAELKRVLRPDGLLAVWIYGACETENSSINELLHRYHYQTIGPYWPPEREYVENNYATLPFPFTRLPAPHFTMRAQWTLDQLIGYFSTWSGTKRYIEANGVNPLEPLRRELLPLWKSVEIPDEVRWPLSLHLGRV
jgi:ubiquinone/menaquinone biosynthesis C-methylase UbiE